MNILNRSKCGQKQSEMSKQIGYEANVTPHHKAGAEYIFNWFHIYSMYRSKNDTVRGSSYKPKNEIISTSTTVYYLHCIPSICNVLLISRWPIT